MISYINSIQPFIHLVKYKITYSTIRRAIIQSEEKYIQLMHNDIEKSKSINLSFDETMKLGKRYWAFLIDLDNNIEYIYDIINSSFHKASELVEYIQNFYFYDKIQFICSDNSNFNKCLRKLMEDAND